MKIRKAVITAANPAQRSLPLQTFVDRDGAQRSALAILIAEVVSAGVDEVAVVIHPGDEPAYSEAAGPERDRLQFVPQPAALGYGHAISLASGFSEGEPVLHLICDHLYITDEARSCAKQLVDAAESESCALSAVQPLRESKITRYGIVGADPVPGQHGLYEIRRVREKPTPTEAEQGLLVPGLRAGHYLGFMGIHVLTPGVFEILDRTIRAARPSERIELSPALNELASKEKYLALEANGIRYDVGARYGMLIAQLALALDGDDREEVLTQLVELLAVRSSTRRNESA